MLGPGATEEERKRAEELARRIVNKMLHDPITTLRQNEKHGSGIGYLHAMEKLFGLADNDDNAERDEQSQK